MDNKPPEQDTSQQDPPVSAPTEANPWPKWATPSSTFDMRNLKPHKCMVDVVQRGNYIHCSTGNHGMRIPQGKMLTKDEQGNWDLIDQPLRDEHGKIVAKNFTTVLP